MYSVYFPPLRDRDFSVVPLMFYWVEWNASWLSYICWNIFGLLKRRQDVMSLSFYVLSVVRLRRVLRFAINYSLFFHCSLRFRSLYPLLLFPKLPSVPFLSKLRCRVVVFWKPQYQSQYTWCGSRFDWLSWLTLYFLSSGLYKMS